MTAKNSAQPTPEEQPGEVITVERMREIAAAYDAGEPIELTTTEILVFAALPDSYFESPEFLGEEDCGDCPSGRCCPFIEVEVVACADDSRCRRRTGAAILGALAVVGLIAAKILILRRLRR